MSQTTRLLKSFSRLLFPVILLLLLSAVAASVWLVHKVSVPPQTAYMVTPEKYAQLSPRGAQITEETWTNRDGTPSRGWLLRGSEGLPAVILLHRYGADRSHVLDLAVKMNEATNYTVLMPDERGHGVNPTVSQSSFGGCETDDAIAALEYLRGLKSLSQMPLVGKNIGFYGVEMGAFSALAAAAKDADIKALALDSVPVSSDDVLASAIDRRFPLASSITSKFAEIGTRFYFYNGCYRRDAACEIAKSIADRQILLLAGADAPNFQDSTAKIDHCFPKSTKVETKTDLNPSGYGLTNASVEQSAAYDQRVIEFFKTALANQN